jgi:NAD(P)-dependent dehydrogenase (short-subunit alcohol dehydrogenase family)
VVAAIEAEGGEAEFVLVDLKSPDDVRALAERAADLDILVNNAGVFPGGATHELPEATFDETFAVRLLSASEPAWASLLKMEPHGPGPCVLRTWNWPGIGHENPFLSEARWWQLS